MVTNPNLKMFDVLRAIESYAKAARGEMPTLRDLMYMTGHKNVSAVNYHIQRLIEAGYITCEKYSPRGITVIKPSPKARKPSTRQAAMAVVEKKKTLREERNRERLLKEAERMRETREAARRHKAGEEDRMLAAVELGRQNDAKARTTGENVVLHDRLPIFKSGRVRGAKVS